MRKILTFILITLCSSPTFSQTDPCKIEFSFVPAELYFDQESKSYKEGLELGTLDMSIQVYSCNYKPHSKQIELAGKFFNADSFSNDSIAKDTIGSSLPLLRVFKATRQDNGLINIQFLAESNRQGLFKFKTKLGVGEQIYFESLSFTIYQLKIPE